MNVQSFPTCETSVILQSSFLASTMTSADFSAISVLTSRLTTLRLTNGSKRYPCP